MTKRAKYILPDIMTLQEVADLFRVTTVTLKKWSDAGTIPCVRINSRGDRRFKKADIMKVLEDGMDR